MGIIYCYTNTITGKKYIGQTVHAEQRKRSHLHEATKRNSDHYFHRSIRKHGWDAFVYEVLEEVIDGSLDDRENHYITTYNTLWPNGYNEVLSNSLSESAIKKMSNTKKAKFAAMSPEARRLLVEKMVQKNIGSKRSVETKKRMSESAKKHLKENPRPKRVWTEEMKKRQSELMKQKYEAGIGRWAK